MPTFTRPIAQVVMSSSTRFRPHGLIKTAMQEQFYNKAHLANVFTGIADPKEHATVALMEVVLYRNVFTEEHFAVTSEQPPSPDSPKRCDLVVNYLEEGSGRGGLARMGLHDTHRSG